MRRRVSCPLLIGRAEELGQLRAALAAAEVGAAPAVMLGGEAGIGKTRLLTEFLAGVVPPARILTGGCVPLTDGLLPFAPVVELLRALEVVDQEWLTELSEPDRAALLGFLPERSSAGPVAGPDAGVGTAVGADQHRLLAALRRLLDRLAASATLVVVLEDLHWADPSTLALLSLLVHGRHRSRPRRLLIGTYRSDELSSRHPLRSLLAELDRADVVRIELPRFAPAETAAQIAGVLNAAAEPALVERLHARCGGNPFLVEELLAAGPDADPLPASTRDIVLRRVRRLPSAHQRLLHAVAVAGRRAEHDLLARVIGIDGDELLEPLRAAVDEQILDVAREGYAFRHALVAEALLAEALPVERTRLHRAYAEALAGRDDGRVEVDGPMSATRAGAAAEIAHHWSRAGEPARALQACADAGLAAERIFAQSEARQHFDRAIGLWREAPSARRAVRFDLAELCRHGAEAAYLEGDTEHAIGLIRLALAEVDPGNDPARAGVMQERLGRYLWANGDAEAASIGAYQRAVELTPDEPSAERARALAGLASAIAYADRPDPVTWCEEALRVARAASARREEGQALQSLGYCQAMAGDVDGGLALCRQALTIAAGLGNSEDHCRAYVNVVGVLRMAGRLSEGIVVAMEGIAVARRCGADRTYGNLLLGDAVEAMILLGRWDEADELLPDRPAGTAHGTPVIATNLWLSAANLHTWRGRFGRAQEFLDACTSAYATHGHGHVRSMLHANLSELCLWQGQFAEASQWIRRELDQLGACEFTSLLGRLVVQGLRAEAGLTRPADLDRLVELLEAMSLRPDPPPDAAGLIVMGWAELSRIRGEDDNGRWSEVADRWTKLDMPWPVAYARWRQAEVLLARRPPPAQRQAGAVALSDAYAIATRLGAEPLRREIISLARRARLMSVIAPSRRPATDGTATLTEREREVLELICAGATNRRVAQQLFISEKTVSIHVSRILAKLGASNRGEAAAIAHRRGIVVR